VVSGGTVTVYLAGVETLATIYAASAGGSPIGSSELTTDSLGRWSCYIDDASYDNTQKFKVVLSKTGMVSSTYDDILLPLNDAAIGLSESVADEIVLFSGTDGSTLKRATTTGLLKATGGVLSAAVSGTDVKTVNSTSLLGSGDVDVQATLVSGTNLKTVGGVSLLGAGDAGILGSAYGGTGNGFTKFSGPLTSEKNFTLPNANATILTSASTVTVAQGGTGATTLTGLVRGAGTGALAPAVSGTDIKTVNSTSLLGSGNVAVQETLVSGTNIKTINSTSLLGSGDITTGGDWVLLQTLTASDSATIDLETTFDSTYDSYVIKVCNVALATDGTDLGLRLKMDGTYQTTNYLQHMSNVSSASAAYASSISVTTYIIVASSVGNTSAVNSTIQLFNPTDSVSHSRITLHSVHTNTVSATVSTLGAATRSGTTLSGARFFATTGNIASGSFSLYGIKK
jgi:hypothetical protein